MCEQEWNAKMNRYDLVLVTMMFFGATFNLVHSVDRIVALPPVKKVVEGNSMSFYCEVEDLNPVTERVIWKKNDEVINESSRSRFSFEFYTTGREDNKKIYKLTINTVEVEDGDYTFFCCIYQSTSVQPMCRGLKIEDIEEVPHDIYPDCQLVRNPVNVGETVTVKCCCEIINPMPSLTWIGLSPVQYTDYKDLRCITHQFTAQREHDETVLRCQMTTNGTEPIKRNCSSGKLQILYKPEVTILGELPFLAGSEEVLICNAKAEPAADRYTWSFIPDLGDRVKYENMVVRLNLQPSDEGTIISCEVRNPIGRGSANITVQMESKKPTTYPTPSFGPKRVNIPRSETDDSTILAIVGVSLLFVSFIIAAALCYFVLLTPTPHHSLDYGGSIIPQPDIYFEPKDNIVGSTSAGQRHVCIQVPGGADSEPVYMEVPGSDKGSQSQYATSRSVYV